MFGWFKKKKEVEVSDRLLEILQILGKYGDKNLQADRGIIYLSKVVPINVDKADIKKLEKLDCEYSAHFMAWFINT